MGMIAEKDTLEHGASKREKEKNKKIKKRKEDPINEIKINNGKEMEIEDNEEDNEEENEILEEEEIKKGKENEVNTKRQNYLLSMKIMSHIEKLFLNDYGLVSLLFGNIKYDLSKEYKISIVTSGINMFFIKELIIPPNRFRPENESFGGEENYYYYQTSAYRKILSLDNDIKELSKKVNETKIN